MPMAGCITIACKSVQEIQGYCGMDHWVKYFVNQCMKSEVMTLTRFVTDGRTDGRTQSIYIPPIWLGHGRGDNN